MPGRYLAKWLPLILAALTGCTPAPETPSAEMHPTRTVEEVRRAITEAMIQPSSCYRNNLDYAVRDKDFLDSVLATMLGSHTLQEVANDPKQYDFMVRDAPFAYSRRLFTQDGLERLSRVLAERFAHPAVTTTADLVRSDFGHIAAHMIIGRRRQIEIGFSESPHLDAHWQWRSAEVTQALRDLLDQHPDKAEAEVRVLIPGAIHTAPWIYSYNRGDDRILIDLPDELATPVSSGVWATPKLGHDFGPYVRGEKSLDVEELQSVDRDLADRLRQHRREEERQ